MEIKAKEYQPKLKMDEVDVYLPRGVKALDFHGENPRGFWRIFQRYEGARFFGLKEYLSALASLVGRKAAKEIIIYAVPEGYPLKRHETAITIEGPARSLLVNETLLHYLSTGTRFRTLAADYPGNKYPWVFMGARYLSREDLAVCTRALAEEGILSTVPFWADKFIGTESHSQLVLWGALRLDKKTERVISEVTKDKKVAATIRATLAFAKANPEVPLYVLGDLATRTVGCAKTFIATAKACKKLGIPLLGGRMDISRYDLNNRPIVDAVFANEDIRKFAGMNPQIVTEVRHLLNQSGLKDFKLVVSSGIDLTEIEAYKEAGADIVGIGEQAAYYLNKGECNFTADAVGFFNSERLIPFAKEGRELSRIIDPKLLDPAKSGLKISDSLVRHDLSDYL